MAENQSKLKRLAELLRKNPNDSFAKFALALELIKADESKKARVLFESVLEQDPEYLGVYYHLGKLYERTDRVEDARSMYTRGIELAEKKNEERTKHELEEALETINLDNDDNDTL